MRKILLALVLSLTITTASAAWTLVGDNDDFIQYFDVTTIRRNGNMATMSYLMNYKNSKTDAGNTYQSQKAQSEFNCKEKQARVLAFSWYSGLMGSGAVVYSNSDASGKWRPVQPESVVETLWKIACGKK